jgi:RND superfamily putative drug exporter
VALLAWMVVLAGLGAGALTLYSPTSHTFTIPGTPAQNAINLIQQRFPQANANGATARVVFAAPAGQKLTSPAGKAAVEAVVARLRAAPQVATVAGPFQAHTVSPAGTAGFAQVSYTVAAIGMTKAARHALAAAAVPGRAAGLRAEMGGTAAQATLKQGASELIGLIAAAVVLVITFGGFIAAGLPLLHAVPGIGISLSARGHPVQPAQLLHLIRTARRFCGPAAVRTTSQRDPDPHGEFEEP